MPDPRTICTVKAGGYLFKSWKTISITHNFENLIPTFQLTCSEGGKLGGDNDSRRLKPQTPVTIELGGAQVLDGAIEVRLASFDGNTHEIIVSGRSSTGQPTLSGAEFRGGNFNGYTLEQIARGVLKPHGVDLNIYNPTPIFTKPFPFFSINPGEFVGEVIARAAKMRGAFVWGDGQGRICLGQGDPTAAVVADLQEGRNILRASIKLDDQGIFSAMNFYGQQPGIGDDRANRAAQGVVNDPNAKTTAVRHEHAEHVGDSEDMAARASIGAAREGWDRVEATVTVAGWFRPDNKLWGIRDNVSVYSPMGFPNSSGKITLAVQAVNYAQDPENGTTTTLTLVKPEYLTSTPNANVATDGAGNAIAPAPKPGTPVPPDYTQGVQGPGGLLGHV